ncbi:class I SAM-dependent methyltransferase [bacterium]|nr:MAG: class I SAM-dependent methyltransferase [bacterium]
MNDDIKCYLCNSDKTFLYKEINGSLIYSCKNCGLKWVINNAMDLKDLYTENYFNCNSKIGYQNYLRDELNHRKNAQNMLKFIGKFKKLENLKVLDVGCAFGFLLDEARNLAGCDTFGNELSDYAYKYAKEKLKLNVSNSALTPGCYPENSFDIVFMIGTIEHLNSPKETINTARHILKPDGLLVITTIDIAGKFPLYSLKPPEHLFYFNHKNLSRLLRGSNFEILKVKTYFSHYYLYDLVYKIGEFASFKFLSPLSGFIKRKFPKLNLKIPTNEIIIVARAV